MDDWRLIQQYTGRSGSGEASAQAAFAQLVQKHMKLVYWTCRRDIGDPDLSEDAAQVVFLLLARKASTLGREVSIAGWLFKTARYVSRDVVRAQQRRKLLEEQAAMHELERSEQNATHSWDAVEPGLNDAIAHLSAIERAAILLRYFEGLSVHDVAVELGTTDNATSKRIARALDKIRLHLKRKEAAITSAALASLLAENVARPIPAHAQSGLSHIAAGHIAAASTKSQVALLYKTVHVSMEASKQIAIATGIAAVAVLVAIVGSVAALRHAGSKRPAVASARIRTAASPTANGPATPLVVAAHSNNLGIVICDPVKMKNVDDTRWAFGAGCSRWLQFTVGGRGELGKTPPTDEIAEVSWDLTHGRQVQGMAPQLARRLGQTLGVSYIATATIRRSTTGSVLTYTLWNLPSMAKVGRPLVASGSAAQIRNKLPDLASQLLSSLGVVAVEAQLPVAPPLADLSDIGMAPWQADPPPAVADKLSAIADHDPLVATMLLDDNIAISSEAEDGLDAMPDNVMVLHAMSGMPNVPSWVTQALDAEQSRFPNNYGIASAQVRRLIGSTDLGPKLEKAPIAVSCHACQWEPAKDTFGEREIAQRLPRLMPTNPWAYYRYALALADSADALLAERDHYNADYPANGASIITGWHAQEEKTAGQAARMLPDNARTAIEYATSAMYNRDQQTAVSWIWKAIALDSDAQQVRTSYRWAMQMFEPQWFGQTDQLLKVIAEIEANGPLFDRECMDIVNIMEQSHLGGDLLANAEQRVDDVAASANPDPYTLESIAIYYDSQKRYYEAGQAYQRVTELLPDRVAAFTNYGYFLRNKQSDYVNADSQYRSAIALSPNDPDSLYGLGMSVWLEGNHAGSGTYFRRYVELYPASSKGHAALADALNESGDRADAISEWRETLAIDPTGDPADNARSGLKKYQ